MTFLCALLETIVRFCTHGQCDSCGRDFPYKQMVHKGNGHYCGTWCRDIGSKWL